MSDLISRQAAIDTICRECQGTFLPCESFPCDEIEALKALPSAQPEKTLLTVKCKFDDEELSKAIEAVKNAELELITEQRDQRWIPVSERLPEESQDVLVCTKYQSITDGMHEHGTWWIAWGDRCYEDEENLILAWMPLPEPYKGEEP